MPVRVVGLALMLLALQPAAAGASSISLKVSPRESLAGEKVAISGKLDKALAATRPKITLQVDRWPFEGGFSTAGTRPGGRSFKFFLTPGWTTQVRVVAGGVSSPVRIVARYPKTRFGKQRAGPRKGTTAMAVRIEEPRPGLLTGRRFYLYLHVAARKAFVRLASISLFARNGSARGTFVFRVPSDSGRKDTYDACIPNLLQDTGFGDTTALDTRCGAAMIPS